MKERYASSWDVMKDWERRRTKEDTRINRMCFLASFFSFTNQMKQKSRSCLNTKECTGDGAINCCRSRCVPSCTSKIQICDENDFMHFTSFADQKVKTLSDEEAECRKFRPDYLIERNIDNLRRIDSFGSIDRNLGSSQDSATRDPPEEQRTSDSKNNTLSSFAAHPPSQGNGTETVTDEEYDIPHLIALGSITNNDDDDTFDPYYSPLDLSPFKDPFIPNIIITNSLKNVSR